MAPSATLPQDLSIHPSTHIKDLALPRKDALPLPKPTRLRLEKAGIDLSDGYPTRPGRPLYREFTLYLLFLVFPTSTANASFYMKLTVPLKPTDPTTSLLILSSHP